MRGMRQGIVARMASFALITLLGAGTPAVWAADPAASVTSPATTGLTVASEPVGAAVYVDGDLKGETPLALPALAEGDHTVRLVKDGFLENSRLVSVPAGGRSLEVRLTPTTGTPLAAMQVEPGSGGGGGGGGGSKKWLLIGLGVAAVGAGVFLLLPKNEAPVVTSVTANPGVALQGATSVSFSAQASDPDGDSLTYSWNFGDGDTGTGANPSHTYSTSGTFDVTVTVSDGDKSATGSEGVVVRSMSGRWTGNIAGIPVTLNLNQSGGTLSGSYTAPYGTGTGSGSVAAPRGFRLTVNVPGFVPITFNGTLDTALNSASGSVTELNNTFSFALTRS